MIAGSIVVLAIVFGLLRVGRHGLAYMSVPWKAYSAPDASFKVNFAGDPEEKSEKQNINGDLWNVVSLNSRHKNHIYVVEYVDVYMVVTEQTAPSIIDQFFQSWMTGLNAKVLSKEKISLARNPGLSFDARIPKGAGYSDVKLEVDARQRGIMAMHNKRLFVVWTLSADVFSWDLQKFLDSFEVPPPEARRQARAPQAAPAQAEVPPAQTVARTPPPSTERPGVEMTTPVARVYVHNRTKKYYPLDCAARPGGAYPIARSLAISQGFKLAEECAK